MEAAAVSAIVASRLFKFLSHSFLLIGLLTCLGGYACLGAMGVHAAVDDALQDAVVSGRVLGLNARQECVVVQRRRRWCQG